MFDRVRYVQSSIVVVFPQVLDVAKYSSDVEAILAGKYNPAIVLQIPGGFEPALPSLIFQSDHGYSQILLSQVNLVLNVTYSDDWQTNAEFGKKYLQDRVLLLFVIVNEVLRRSASITGITTVAELRSLEPQDRTIRYMANKTLASAYAPDIYEISLKLSRVLDELYFSNVTCDFYRKWSIPHIGPSVFRMSTDSATSHGIRIVSELNDRYAYNEVNGYYSSAESARQLINLAFDETASSVNKVVLEY